MHIKTGRSRIVVGTRGSALARWQTDYVCAAFRKIYPDTVFEEKIIQTEGDTSTGPLCRPGAADGLFTRAIERELLNGSIDCAVHSYKDLPTTSPDTLTVAAVLNRHYIHDVLISSKYSSLDVFPAGSTIATASPRRSALIRKLYPHITCVPIRGNVETRIRKCDEGIADGIILAQAGVTRMDLAYRITQLLDMDRWYYAPAQGAIAIQIRTDDTVMHTTASSVTNPEDEELCRAEKEFCRVLGAGCHVPFGVRTHRDTAHITLYGMISSSDAAVFMEDSATAPRDTPERAGGILAQQMLKNGANTLLLEPETIT